jgi:hypothetical protein
MIARLKIDSTGAGTSRVEVNGVNLAHALVGYDIRDRVGGVPNVTLHLLGTGSVELAQVDVQLRPEVAEALIALGWTPPAEPASGG